MPQSENVEAMLGKALPLLKASILRNHRNVSLEDVCEDIIGGSSLLWAVYMDDTLIAAFTTCVMRHQKRKTLYIEYLGGVDMKIWIHAALNVLKDVATRAGLAAIEADGRIGFARHAKNFGFEETYRHFEMEI